MLKESFCVRCIFKSILKNHHFGEWAKKEVPRGSTFPLINSNNSFFVLKILFVIRFPCHIEHSQTII